MIYLGAEQNSNQNLQKNKTKKKKKKKSKIMHIQIDKISTATSPIAFSKAMVYVSMSLQKVFY